MESGLVPVGAGVVMGWVGTLVVALRPETTRATARVPTPHPNLSRPYGDEGPSPKKPILERTSPAPTGTKGLLPKNLYLKDTSGRGLFVAF